LALFFLNDAYKSELTDPEFKALSASIKQVQNDKKKYLTSIDRKKTEKQALKAKLDEEKQKTYGNFKGEFRRRL
jgi:hypothetical protein